MENKGGYLDAYSKPQPRPELGVPDWLELVWLAPQPVEVFDIGWAAFVKNV
jgi:hypothetical protein